MWSERCPSQWLFDVELQISSLVGKCSTGQSKYQLCLELPSDEAGNAICVRHLAAEIEKKTGVPEKGQKIIFKGKSLTNLDDRLSQLNLKPGSKVMLIGKKPSCVDDQALEQLKNIENVLEKHEKKLGDVIVELGGVQQGFVSSDIRSNVISQINRRIIGCSEDFMKDLEKLDAVQMSDDGKEARLRRKTMVDRCQKGLGQCDKMTNQIVELQESKS